MSNINPEVVRHQGMVVSAMCPDVPFYQVQTQYKHGQSMDLFLFQRTEDLVVFLDVDAIPLHKDSLKMLCEMTLDGETIAGAPQRSNHIENDKHIFVAPSIMAISPNLYRSLGCPSALETWRGDVAEEWTYMLQEQGVEPRYLDVIRHDTSQVWNLDEGRTFGLNTTFGTDGKELFFHSFQARMRSQQASFISKCMEVLRG